MATVVSVMVIVLKFASALVGDESAIAKLATSIAKPLVGALWLTACVGCVVACAGLFVAFAAAFTVAIVSPVVCALS